MKFIPYGRQWIDKDDIEEVVKVLRSDWITTCPKIKEFENVLYRYAVAVDSGTSALDIAVQALNIPKRSHAIGTGTKMKRRAIFADLTILFSSCEAHNHWEGGAVAAGDEGVCDRLLLPKNHEIGKDARDLTKPVHKSKRW